MPQNIVYFLGAGASRCFGYPVTGSIMPEIIHKLRKHDLFQLDENVKTDLEKKQEEELLYFLQLLYPGLKNHDGEKEKEKIPGVTEILSMIDFFCFNAIPAHCELTVEKLYYFRDLFNRAVGELLLTYDNEEYTPSEKALMEKFMAPIRYEKRVNKVTIITTNYDLLIDNEFSDAFINKRVDHGIQYRDVYNNNLVHQPQDPYFQYYKLHGSLNWLKCGLCGQYYINPYGSIIHQAFREKLDDGNTCICSAELKLSSVLVAPSFVRDVRDVNLLHIWKGALEAMRTADRLIMIGYSLPPEDLGIKSIFMRALNGRDKKRLLTVDAVQFGEAARSNYENIFSNHKLTYYSEGLENYLQIPAAQFAAN